MAVSLGWVLWWGWCGTEPAREVQDEWEKVFVALCHWYLGVGGRIIITGQPCLYWMMHTTKLQVKHCLSTFSVLGTLLSFQRKTWNYWAQNLQPSHLSHSNESPRAAPNSVKRYSRSFLYPLLSTSNFHWPHSSCLAIKGSGRSYALIVHVHSNIHMQESMCLKMTKTLESVQITGFRNLALNLDLHNDTLLGLSDFYLLQGAVT